MLDIENEGSHENQQTKKLSQNLKPVGSSKLKYASDRHW